MAQMPDYYRLLNLSVTASDEEIKRAYRHLAKKYHPDINKSCEAESIFKLLNDAYQTLINPAKRRRYDLKLRYLAYKEYRKYGVSGTQRGYSAYYHHFNASPPDSYREKVDMEDTKDGKLSYTGIMNRFVFYSLMGMLILGIIFGFVDLVFNYRFLGLVVCLLLAFVLWSAWTSKAGK